MATCARPSPAWLVPHSPFPWEPWCWIAELPLHSAERYRWPKIEQAKTLRSCALLKLVSPCSGPSPRKKGRKILGEPEHVVNIKQQQLSSVFFQHSAASAARGFSGLLARNGISGYRQWSAMARTGWEFPRFPSRSDSGYRI